MLLTLPQLTVTEKSWARWTRNVMRRPRLRELSAKRLKHGRLAGAGRLLILQVDQVPRAFSHLRHP